MMYLSDMSESQFEAAVEAHFDRLFDEYYRDDPDAWERDEPDWRDILQFVEDWKSDDIPGLVRDYLDGDGDLQTEAYKSGKLQGAQPDRLPKDPEAEWKVIDDWFEANWSDDDMMCEVWDWLPTEHKRKLIESLIENADYNGLREEYNKRRSE